MVQMTADIDINKWLDIYLFRSVKEIGHLFW